MDWTQLIGPAIGVLGVVSGGLFARGKNRADSHSLIVADGVGMVKLMRTELDQALSRIDAMEARELRRDDLARQHLRWDWRQVRRLADAGIEVEDPPPLFVYDDLTKGF